jgi:streptomycin 6-kinase
MQPSHNIPARLARTIVDLHEAEGVAWIERLPDTIAGYEQRWSLTVLPPFPNLSYNYVAPAVRADGTELVLKLGVPNSELQREGAALRHYAGHGIAALVEADLAGGALLIERLRPGTLLAELEDDQQATAIAAEVMRQLWRPAPAQHSFPSVADWAGGMQHLRAEFGGGTGPFPPRMVELAERLFAELLGSMAAPVLLHGDLHHENIMAATRRPWLAIDPKGVVGEPAYEVGALLRNRLEAGPDLGKLQARRLDQLAEALQLDRERLLGWSVAQAVLSAWWSYEDHGHGWEPMIDLAEVLAGLIRK